MLDNLSRAASAKGYTVSEKTSSLAGVDAARNQIYARCNSEHGRIDLVSIDGTRVSVELEFDSDVGGALEIAGGFPGAGHVTRTAVLTGYSTTGSTGSRSCFCAMGASIAALLALGAGKLGIMVTLVLGAVGLLGLVLHDRRTIARLAAGSRPASTLPGAPPRRLSSGEPPGDDTDP